MSPVQFRPCPQKTRNTLKFNLLGNLVSCRFFICKPEINFITKSGEERSIPICSDLSKFLQEWFPVNNPDNTLNYCNPDKFIVNYGNNEKYAKWYISHRFKLALMKLNIEGNFHCLRHSFASELIERGVDIETVRELLGHKRISTTALYLKSMDKTKKDAVSKIS